MKLSCSWENILLNASILFSLLLTTFVTFACMETAVASSHPYLPKHGVIFSTGDKYLTETDVTIGSSTPQPIRVKRHYNSQSNTVGLFGYGWSGGVNNLSRISIIPEQIPTTSG